MDKSKNLDVLHRHTQVLCWETHLDISTYPALTKCFAEKRDYGTRACLQVFTEGELKLQTIVRLKSQEDLTFLKCVFSSLKSGLDEHSEKLDEIWDTIGKPPPKKVRKLSTNSQLGEGETQDLKLLLSDSDSEQK